MHNFLADIESLASRQPDRCAIVLGAEEISFGTLWESIQIVSNNAMRLGYRPGDSFIFASKPTPRTIAMALGLTRAGLRLAFIDPFTATMSFPVRVALIGPKLVLAESSLFAIGSTKTGWLRKLLKIVIADYGSIPSADFFHTGPRLPFLPKGSRNAMAEFYRPVAEFSKPSRVANSDSIIVFTSGTTADPKGVVHSLETISANFSQTAKIFDFKPGDRVLCEAMTVGLVAVSAGATWIIPDGKRNPTFNKYFAVPTDAIKLMNGMESEAAKKNQIEYFGMGGAPIPPSLVNRVLEVVGDQTKIVCIYGMTEILPVAYCDGREKLVPRAGDFLGKPLAGVDLRLAADQELEVRGSGLMKNYLGRKPAAWHPTGDLAKIDEHGNILMLSRKKNMLIRGDMNVYPSLYEPGLTTIPGVADAVIVGVPDEFGDDRIALFILPKADEPNHEELRKRVHSRLPEFIDQQALPDILIMLESMPVSGRGQKRDMTKLVEMAAERLAS